MKTVAKIVLAALSGIALFVILGVVAAIVGGCTADQIATAQKGVDVAKVGYVAATQAVDAGQRALDQLDVELNAATVQVGTLPVGSDSRKSAESMLATLQKARGVAAQSLATAQQHEGQAKAAVDFAQNVVTAMKTGSAPDTAPLGAFGAYGELAGIALTGIFSIVTAAKNAKLNATVTAQNNDIQTHKDALEALTGEPHPVDALVAGLTKTPDPALVPGKSAVAGG